MEWFERRRLVRVDLLERKVAVAAGDKVPAVVGDRAAAAVEGKDRAAVEEARCMQEEHRRNPSSRLLTKKNYLCEQID